MRVALEAFAWPVASDALLGLSQLTASWEGVGARQRCQLSPMTNALYTRAKDPCHAAERRRRSASWWVVSGEQTRSILASVEGFRGERLGLRLLFASAGLSVSSWNAF